MLQRWVSIIPSAVLPTVDMMLMGSLAVTRPTCLAAALLALDLPQNKMIDQFLGQSEAEESVAWFSKNCT